MMGVEEALRIRTVPRALRRRDLGAGIGTVDLSREAFALLPESDEKLFRGDAFFFPDRFDLLDEDGTAGIIGVTTNMPLPRSTRCNASPSSMPYFSRTSFRSVTTPCFPT